MNGFFRCRWFVPGGWRLAFQDIAGELVINILQLVDGLDVWQLYILVNVKRNGSILFWIQIEVNAGGVFLEVPYRFIVGNGAKVKPGQSAWGDGNGLQFGQKGFKLRKISQGNFLNRSLVFKVVAEAYFNGINFHTGTKY
jgi:hypothetical protein